MNAQELKDNAGSLIADDKGLLATDESNLACNRRFARLEIPKIEETRRAYREWILTRPGLGKTVFKQNDTHRVKLECMIPNSNTTVLGLARPKQE